MFPHPTLLSSSFVLLHLLRLPWRIVLRVAAAHDRGLPIGFGAGSRQVREDLARINSLFHLSSFSNHNVSQSISKFSKNHLPNWMDMVLLILSSVRYPQRSKAPTRPFERSRT